MAQNRDLKNENERAIRRILYAGTICSAADLEKECGLSHGTVMNLIKEFYDRQEILLHDKTGSSVGRKTYLYKLNPDYMHICAASVERWNEKYRFSIRLLDLGGTCLDSLETDRDAERIADIETPLSTMLERHPETSMMLVSTPGVCENGVISLPGKETYDIGAWIRQRNLPYVVENDVNVACIGFSRQSGRYRDLALVYQPAPMMFGCGIMIHGRLYNGFSHAAGELRYAPFMRHGDKLSAEKLLKDQILTAAAVLNPEVIAYCSECNIADIVLDENDMPEKHRPELVRISSLNSLVFQGLYSIGMHVLTENTGGF